MSNFTKNCYDLTNFVTSKELQEKSAFLKIATQVFEAGNFVNIVLRFWGFWGSFSYKSLSYKKRCTSFAVLLKHLFMLQARKSLWNYMWLLVLCSGAYNATYYIATTGKLLQVFPKLKVKLKLKQFSTYHSFVKHT